MTKKILDNIPLLSIILVYFGYCNLYFFFKEFKIDKTIIISYQTAIKFLFLAILECFNKNYIVKKKIFQTVTKGYEIPGGNLLNKKNNSSVKIKGIIFTGVLTKRNTDLKFSLVDQVWLIMKSIFEERTFNISMV